MRVLLLAALAASAHGYSETYVKANAQVLFDSFKRDYGKRYTSVQEEARRLQVFTANMLQAAAHEKEQTRGAMFGANQFADLTAEEFKVYHNLQVPETEGPKNTLTEEQKQRVQAGDVDWRTKGAVTHVKNQAQCGSCWSFSTTGGIEGQWALAGNTLTPVSEQELVSCDHVDQGCNGGLMDNALKWLLANKNGQIVTEASYPYKSGTGVRHACESTEGKAVGATIKSYKDIEHTEDAMQTFVAESGPLSIAVDATKWQTYQGGVLDHCCEFGICRLDHGVLIVGFGADYWIVKNSWGPSWGESGYIRIHKGSNQCGINKSPTTSIV